MVRGKRTTPDAARAATAGAIARYSCQQLQANFYCDFHTGRINVLNDMALSELVFTAQLGNDKLDVEVLDN